MRIWFGGCATGGTRRNDGDQRAIVMLSMRSARSIIVNHAGKPGNKDCFDREKRTSGVGGNDSLTKDGTSCNRTPGPIMSDIKRAIGLFSFHLLSL